MPVGPLSPSEIGIAKANLIPEEVFVAVNKLLALKFSNGRAIITQKEILEELTKELDSDHEKTLERRHIFDIGYLNFEEAYRMQGWKVRFDKPGYNESYDAFFEFKT